MAMFLLRQDKPPRLRRGGLFFCKRENFYYYANSKRFEKVVQFEQKEQRLTGRYPRQASVQRIEQIQRLRQQGRTIPEIRELLRAQDDGE